MQRILSVIRTTYYRKIGRFIDQPPRHLGISHNLCLDGLHVTNLEKLFNINYQSESFIKLEKLLSSKSPEIKEKKFIKYYVGGDYKTLKQEFTQLSKFLFEIASSEILLSVAKDYLGDDVKLSYVELNKVEHSGGSRMQSQRWHRDPALLYCLKVFIYWNDVDLANGAFEFVVGSNRFGKNYDGVERFNSGSFYPEKMQVEGRVMSGLKGTVIFCDTTGYHRGGFVEKGSDGRVMSTFVYYPGYEKNHRNLL